jgi:hypothetical protein
MGAVSFARLSAPFKVVVILIDITLISELASRALAFLIRNSSPPYHFFVWIEYTALTCVYLCYFKSEDLQKALRISIPFFAILCFVNTFFFQHLFTFPSNILLIEHTILILFSLLLFKQMIFYPVYINILSQEIFWFNTIILFYYTSDFLIWAFHNYFVRSHLNTHLLNTLNYANNILFYLGLGFTIFLNSKKRDVANGQD